MLRREIENKIRNNKKKKRERNKRLKAQKNFVETKTKQKKHASVTSNRDLRLRHRFLISIKKEIKEN